MSKPIKPFEVGAAKGAVIPAAVFDAFNAEIALRFDVHSAVVKQAAVVARLTKGGMKASEIYQAGWLNVEQAYRDAGWTVVYERPSYNESGDAVFTFSSGGSQA